MKQNIDKPKNDVIYVRVSSEEQVQGFSLDSQEKICREFSQRAGHEVLRVFRGEGESAKTLNRPELQKMILFCEKEKRKVSRVIVYKLDRFSRSMQDHMTLEIYFNKLGISLASVTENLENTPSGKLNKHILAAFSQFDNDVRAQRTIEGMKARALRGLWPGIAPWGYINTVDKTGSKIIAPHPERASVVKKLFQAHATGKYSFKELAIMANKLGQKSRHGLKLTKQVVAKIIKNPIYCGRIVVPKFGVDVQGSHKPIVSTELFDEASYSKRGVAGRKLARNKGSPDYPLRGIQCSCCGKNFTGGPSTSKTGKIHKYYNCMSGKENCPKKKAIKKIDFEEEFTELLLELTPNNDYLDVLEEAIRLAHKTELTSVSFSEKKITARTTELKSEKDELLNLKIKGKLSDEEFVEANDKYKSQITELEKELSELSSPELEIESVVASGIKFIKEFPKTWRELDVKDLRVLNNLLFPSNLVYHYPTIKTPELCCIYNIKSEFLDTKYREVTYRSKRKNTLKNATFTPSLDSKEYWIIIAEELLEFKAIITRKKPDPEPKIGDFWDIVGEWE